ncbi:MAG: autotransporter-associated beta strand repeat-containing protein [Thermoguttaceae bacterium]|jgi:autotransporter-associated beta strand protein|nr:autotransporter-associated beta strand repeat-containing protein [Thermoguttaceae bacterium]
MRSLLLLVIARGNALRLGAPALLPALICLFVAVAGSGHAQTNWSTTPLNGFWGEAANWTGGTPSSSRLANFTSSTVTTTYMCTGGLNENRYALGLTFSGESDFAVNMNDGSGAGTLYIYGSGISVGGGTQTITAPPRVSAVSFPITSDGQLIINNSLMMNNQLNGTVTFSGSGNTSVNSLSRRWPNEATNMNIVKNGTGTLTILSAYSQPANVKIDSVVAPTGTTTINQGTISINAEANLGRDPGGYYRLEGEQVVYVPGAFNPAALTLDGGTLRATAGFAIDDDARGVTLGPNGGTFEVPSAAHTLTIANAITGPGSLSTAGPGTLALSAANTYSGDTRPAVGTLLVSHAEALAGSTLDMAAGDTGAVAFGTPAAYTFGGLKGERDLNMAGKTLSVGANGEDTEYSGALSNGALTKVGGGILALSGTNTHSATAINEGTLQFVTDASLGAGGAGITLDGGMLEYAGTIANHSVNRPITLTADSFIKSAGWPESLRLTGKLTDDGGAFGFTLTQGPVLLVNAANDYDGLTIVQSGGSLYASADGVLGSTVGATIVQSGGILSVDTNYATPETLHLNGGVLRTSFGGGGTATWAGDVVLGAQSTIRAKVDNGQSTVVIAGQISGGYGLNLGQGTSEAGIVKLTGNNIYTGATNLNWGTLVVDGSIATSSGLTLAAGTLLKGTGSVPALAGAGLVSPGNSPGILTATSVDPAGGLDFAFEFTVADPIYGSPTGSLNDVLRLTDLSAPFAGPLGAGNEINLYLNVAEVAAGDVFRGGFYTDLGEDFSGLLSGAKVSAFVALDGNGPNVFEGAGYYSLADAPWPLQLEAALRSVPAAADFGTGLIGGYVMQVKVVPEPSALFLAALALACLAWPLRRRAGW